jgi:hypothetical protein
MGFAQASGASPPHPQPSKPRQSHPKAVYKGCTKDAPRMHTLLTGVHLSCTRCAPLVHGAGQWGMALGGGGLSLGRFGGCRRLGLCWLASLLFARQRTGRDDRAGHVVLGFPAVLGLAGDNNALAIRQHGVMLRI